MVQSSGDGRPSGVRRLVEDRSIRPLIDTYLEDNLAHCTGNTIRKYRWALLCLERVHPNLPRVTRDIIRFVQAEPLGANSQRVLYETLQDFYAWIKANEDPLVPELPYVWFGRRHIGEKRGAKSGHRL